MTEVASYLNALRAFESAARHQSFARAATELCVSHSVVSRHVRNLEQWLDTRLFVRTGNRVELTEEGRMFAPKMSEAFRIIRESCDDLRTGGFRRVIRVCAEPAFATRWLRRHAAEFRRAAPNVEVELRSSWSPPNIRDGTADVVIHFEGRLPSGPSNVDRLFPIDGYPACSPEFLRERSAGSSTPDVLDLPLVHDNGRGIWHQWFSDHAPDSDAWKNGLVYSDLALAIDAAVDGEGVILADDIICSKEIESGALVKLDPRALRCTWYCAVYDDESPRDPAVAAFRAWLKESASQSAAASA